MIVCVVGVFPDFQSGVAVIWVSQMCLMESGHFGKLKPAIMLFQSSSVFWLYDPTMPHVAIVLQGTSCFHIFPMSVFIFAITILDSPTSDLPYGRLICLYTHQSPDQSYPKGRCHNIQLLLPFSLRVLKNIRDCVWCSCQILSSTFL